MPRPDASLSLFWGQEFLRSQLPEAGVQPAPGCKAETHVGGQSQTKPQTQVETPIRLRMSLKSDAATLN